MIMLALTRKYFFPRPRIRKTDGYFSFKFLWPYIAWISTERARKMLVREASDTSVMVEGP